MHGWCAERENRGKGGSGQGKIGAKVVGSRDPVGIQSGTNFGIFRTAFGPGGKQLKSP